MKNTKRFLAMAAALSLAACAAAPMAMTASAAATEGKVTISDEQGTGHTYSVYKIFDGTVNASGKLESIIFAGDNFSNFLAALQADTTIGADFATCTDEASVAIVLGGYTNNSDKAKAFADFVAANKTFVEEISTNATNSIDLGEDGYYLIIENSPASSQQSFAMTSYLLAQYDASAGAEITAKATYPTVDKLVQDEAADKDANSTDENGWGETADHAINESFQFKLVATLSADSNYADYDTYRVIFNDTLNSGVTYDSIASVKVNDNTVDPYNATTAKAGYVLSAPAANANGGTLTITIGDIKEWLGEDSWADTSDVTVTVIYNAHLNENAAIEKTDKTGVATSYSNVNKVSLEYSNNPNVTGSGDSATAGDDEETGTTPDDYVWVFTYEVDNVKYKNSQGSGNELAGAEFKLYASDGTTEIGLIYDSTLAAYRPVKTGETATVMTSASTGIFNIKGLDAGTYVLKETKAPTGYTAADDTTITIAATHQETDTTGATAKLSLDGSANMSNSIVDTSSPIDELIASIPTGPPLNL